MPDVFYIVFYKMNSGDSNSNSHACTYTVGKHFTN